MNQNRIEQQFIEISQRRREQLLRKSNSQLRRICRSKGYRFSIRTGKERLVEIIMNFESRSRRNYTQPSIQQRRRPRFGRSNRRRSFRLLGRIERYERYDNDWILTRSRRHISEHPRGYSNPLLFHEKIECKICLVKKTSFLKCLQCSNLHCSECNIQIMNFSSLRKCPFCRYIF